MHTVPGISFPCGWVLLLRFFVLCAWQDDMLADARTGKTRDARGEDTGFRAPWNRSGTYGSLRRTQLTLDPETRPRTRARQGGYGGTTRW